MVIQWLTESATSAPLRADAGLSPVTMLAAPIRSIWVRASPRRLLTFSGARRRTRRSCGGVHLDIVVDPERLQRPAEPPRRRAQEPVPAPEAGHDRAGPAQGVLGVLAD